MHVIAGVSPHIFFGGCFSSDGFLFVPKNNWNLSVRVEGAGGRDVPTPRPILHDDRIAATELIRTTLMNRIVRRKVAMCCVSGVLAIAAVSCTRPGSEGDEALMKAGLEALYKRHD